MQPLSGTSERLWLALLAGIDQQLRQCAARGFHLVFLVAARPDEAPCRSVRHEDLSGLTKRWTRNLCHAQHLTRQSTRALQRTGSSGHRPGWIRRVLTLRIWIASGSGGGTYGARGADMIALARPSTFAPHPMKQHGRRALRRSCTQGSSSSNESYISSTWTCQNTGS